MRPWNVPRCCEVEGNLMIDCALDMKRNTPPNAAYRPMKLADEYEIWAPSAADRRSDLPPLDLTVCPGTS